MGEKNNFSEHSIWRFQTKIAKIYTNKVLTTLTELINADTKNKNDLFHTLHTYPK